MFLRGSGLVLETTTRAWPGLKYRAIDVVPTGPDDAGVGVTEEIVLQLIGLEGAE